MNLVVTSQNNVNKLTATDLLIYITTEIAQGGKSISCSGNGVNSPHPKNCGRFIDNCTLHKILNEKL
jgi:uncharacterized Zn-finger protein